MRKTFIAVQSEQDGIYNARVIEVSNGCNLLRELDSPNNISANVFSSKKAAQAVVETWISVYKKDNKYKY